MRIVHLLLAPNVQGHKATSGALNCKSFSKDQPHVGPQSLKRSSRGLQVRVSAGGSWMPGTRVPSGRFHKLEEARWALEECEFEQSALETLIRD